MNLHVSKHIWWIYLIKVEYYIKPMLFIWRCIISIHSIDIYPAFVKMVKRIVVNGILKLWMRMLGLMYPIIHLMTVLIFKLIVVSYNMFSPLPWLVPIALAESAKALLPPFVLLSCTYTIIHRWLTCVKQYGAQKPTRVSIPSDLRKTLLEINRQISGI